MTTVNCPTCNAPVPWTEASVYRPFCSKRCRLIDLGEWLDESKRIPGGELDESDIGAIPDDRDPANDSF